MGELYSIIQAVMKYQKSGKIADVILNDAQRYCGVIQNYTGSTLTINDTEISINDIDSIEEHIEIDFSVFVMNRVLMILDSSEEIDAVVMNADSDKIDYINENGKGTVEIEKVVRISCGDKEVVLKKAELPEEAVDGTDDKAAADTNNEAIAETNDETAAGTNDETMTDTGDEAGQIADSDDAHEPNAFEQGLIDGNKAVVGDFVSHSDRLDALGYTDKEIERIEKNYKTASWGTEPIKIASRIYHMQCNKNGLARQYYEIALGECRKGSPNYIKALNSLHKFVVEDGDEKYIAFWRKNSSYLKDNALYCDRFIEAQLRSKQIKINEFEKLLVEADKKAAKEYIQDEERLVSLGYTADDIERIGKAYTKANWETGWYRIAARLFAMQLNKNGLAEIYYESALAVANKKGDEYTKILNALASIKMHEDGREYTVFFRKYREKLKNNVNYCVAYANALLAQQNWSQIEKDMPMLRQQLAGNPGYLDRLEAEVNYYKTMPPFVLSENKVLSGRYADESLLYDQEKGLIEKLPDRGALKTLLEIYFFNKEEKAYFSLVEYALFFIKEERTTMLKLLTMLHATEDMDYIVRILPEVPVLWCDSDLVRKYMNNATGTDDADGMDSAVTRLRKHIRSVGIYRALNSFETGIINRDYDEVRRFMDNGYLLEELGYSDDEIDEIVSTDVEMQFSEDIYTMRRVLAFQGNKNHTAEKYLFEAYYDNKIDMCNRLFPLLIEEKRADLILGLFDFDRNLGNNMTSLRRFYYLALCMAEKDDDVFFTRMESEWMNYPEDEILDRMIRIATERKDNFLVKQLELQKNKPRGNEFETAVIEADNETIRKFVKNANLLVELGYTPEEIQKINKIFGLGGTNNGTKPGQIASRVYLYQKNKNNLAERLYLNAMAEDSQEDVITDCKALFQIYTGQHNYEMVCKIYEEYLYTEMEDKFNRTYASTYCIALYELNRYEEFLQYIRNNKDHWEGFTLAANLLYVAEMMNTHEFDAFIRENLSESTYRPDIISKYILHALDRDISEVYSEKFADLINMFFVSLPDDDLRAIAKKIEMVPDDDFVKPKASLLAAFANPGERAHHVSVWLEFMEERMDPNKETDVLLQLYEMFPALKETLVERAMHLYLNADREIFSDYKNGALEDFIYKNVDDEDLRIRWCDLQGQSLSAGEGTLHSLSNYLDIVISLRMPDKFWEVYKRYKALCESELPSQQLFDTVLIFYNTAKAEHSVSQKEEIADELIALSGDFVLDYVGCKNMADICDECGKNFEAKIYLTALNKLVRGNSEEEPDTLEKIDEKDLDYVSYLQGMLTDDDYIDFAKKCSGWSKYIAISEEEELVIERLRNTIKTADLWVTEEVNILAKAIICEPMNSVYWKLLYTWITHKPGYDEKIVGTILYQLSSQGNKETEDALWYAVSNDLKAIALNLTLKMLDMHVPDYNISAQKNIREMINKGWFEEPVFRENVPRIIKKIGENTDLKGSSDYEWNSVCAAVDLAIATADYQTLVESFSEYLSKSCAKQGCAIIAAMMLDGQREFIADVFEYLDSSFADVPYKDMVHELYAQSKIRELSPAEKTALKCIQSDYGNVLGVNTLLGFYCDMCITDRRELGLETIRVLMKYMQYDPVLYEVAGCFLKNEQDLDSNVQFYEYMYEYLRSSQSENPIEYAVGQMVCGENYLRMCGRNVESFKRMIEERYPKYLEIVKTYQEFCDCVAVELRGTDCAEFAGILFKAVFVGDWVDVFEYKPSDETVKTVLQKNIKTDRINIADDYHRSVIKSVALFVLKHIDDMWEIVDNSERIRMIWDNIGNAGCSYEYFSKVVQDISDECIPELTAVWSLDIETLTVYKKFFGRYVLEQEHCTDYASVFSVFANARSTDVFGNTETLELLRSFDRDKAIDICRNYEQLYVRPSGPVQLYTMDKSAFKDSDYENNVFSNYLSRNTSDFYSIERRYERFKKKYELICEMYNVGSFEEANSQRFDLNEKRQIFSLRALYFYYSVLSEQEVDDGFATCRQAEIINATTIALSDDKYLSELNTFVAAFGSEERYVLGALILAEQDKLDYVARTVIDSAPVTWKAYLCARLVASYGTKGKENSLCKECKSIARKKDVANLFWIKNYKCGKSIGRFTPELYLGDTESVGTTDNVDSTDNVKSVSAEAGSEYDAYKEIIVSLELPDENDEISFETPLFIKEFLQSQYDDKKLCELQSRWETLSDSVDNGKETQDSLNELAIDIGISLIKKSNTGVDEKIMGEVFGLVKKYSIHDTYRIGGLHDVFQSYITGYSDLDLLAASVNENRFAIGHLRYEQNTDQKFRVAQDKKSRSTQDIEAAAVLVDILTNIAADLSSAMGDETIKERLRLYQDELYKNTKKISKFRNAVNALGKMIQEKINSINYVPSLIVSHLGSGSPDSSKNYNWNETWLEGADHGTVRGVVINRGGAPAKNVKLTVMVNSELRGTRSISEIVPGRKIPFSVTYTKEDISDGIVNWSANATYYDESSGKSRTSNGYGEIHVQISDEDWGISHVGREKFNTQFAAEGEDFCGRTNELLKLNGLYNVSVPFSKYPSLLVTGLRRAGKSSVIKYFKESLRERENLAPVFVDAQGIDGDITNAFFNLVFNELYKYYRKEMDGFVEFKKKWGEISKEKDWVGHLPTYFMELSELLGNRKVIFIMDEMENVFYANRFASAQSEEQFFGMIRSIIQNYQEYVSFIFCGSDRLLTSCLEQKRESQMFQVLQRIYVGRMGINDIRDLFDKYNSVYDVKFGDDAIDAIMYYTNGLVWYTKVIAYNILDRIVDPEHIIRDEIHAADVDYVVELLISGDLGSELIDLLDNNFGAKRKAIIRAMARATKSPNESVNIDMISAELPRLSYMDDETGEVLGTIPEEDISKNLNVLEKMDFIERDLRKERAYRFTAELYRLLMLSERKIDKFIVVSGGGDNE